MKPNAKKEPFVYHVCAVELPSAKIPRVRDYLFENEISHNLIGLLNDQGLTVQAIDIFCGQSKEVRTRIIFT